MKMKRETKLKMLAGEMELEVTVPPCDVMDQIAEIYEPIEAQHKKVLLKTVSKKPELTAYIQKNRGKSPEEMQEEMMALGLFDPESLDLVSLCEDVEEVKISKSDMTKMAGLIEGYCVGLSDDLHEMTKRDVLFQTAEAVYKYVNENVLMVTAKN
jgi:hypothetical protein